MTSERTFYSDNASGIHPKILQKIVDSNQGHAAAYGNDALTKEAESLFRQHFGNSTQSYFVLTGTGANVIAMQSVLRPYEAVITAATAHLHCDECGAPERISGCKVLTCPSEDGKLSPEVIMPFLRDTETVHRVQPRLLSITQATELGTLYQAEEILALSAFCKKYNLLLHVDGARIANAACALSQSLKEASIDLGIDILSFGGTKNGLMLGEAIVYRTEELAMGAAFVRKQSMQLASKMRFIAAQFVALLEDELWKKNASHANAMARYMREQLIGVIEPLLPVESNAVFLKLPLTHITRFIEKHHCSVWDSSEGIVRIMMSFDTSTEEIDYCVANLKAMLR